MLCMLLAACSEFRQYLACRRSLQQQHPARQGAGMQRELGNSASCSRVPHLALCTHVLPLSFLFIRTKHTLYYEMVWTRQSVSQAFDVIISFGPTYHLCCLSFALYSRVRYSHRVPKHMCADKHQRKPGF